MSRYRFRLASILRFRRAEKMSAVDALRAANDNARLAFEERERARNEFHEMPPRPSVMRASAFQSDLQRRKSRAAAVIAAEAELTAARAIAAQRDAEYTRASQRVSALERLDDRQRQTHEIQAQRAEQRVVDDLVLARHRRFARGRTW
jgi:flagellar biosynthesis chaperone FliJ